MFVRPLIECVPNFSEGRRPEVVRKIVHAIRSGGAVYILDVSSDADHNRSVVTVAGPPQELYRAIFEGIRAAAELIDMTQHQGVHPRFGAADVVPFIPLRNATIDDCVALARRLGQQVGTELDLPVFLYEAAATRPERRNLADLRHSSFQYEQLREAIEVDPAYMPDFGPAQLDSAGAVIIGARQPLIAFNVYLSTDDVRIAQRIARAVRASSGGLAGVKALGFLVEGQAQVSMNLTDYRRTPVFRAVEMIRREAARYGVNVVSSELVGLAPQDALLDSAYWYLQLDGLAADQLLEARLARAETEQSLFGQDEPPVPGGAAQTVQLPDFDEESRPSAFVSAVAETTPTPGGGAVTALVGSLAAALTEMVAGLSADDQQPQLEAALVAAQELRERLLDSIVRDVVAYDEVIAVSRLTRLDAGQDQLLQQKLLAAAEVPLQVCRMAGEVLELAAQVVDIVRSKAVIDLAVGANMALAALESAGLNIRVNLLGLGDDERARAILDEFHQLREDVQPLHQTILTTAEQRAGLRE